MAAVLDMPRCKAVRGPSPLAQHSMPQTLTPTRTLTTDADPNPVLGDLVHAPNPPPLAPLPVTPTPSLSQPLCQVIAFWEKDVQQIFNSYAAADMDIDAQAAQDSVNLTELMYMLTEGTLTRALALSPNPIP